ncbi:response regulator transcription factor [Corynebacterium felinum]|uniref:DNA-binding NarL/FixJ family response regulator n=1 Tax=Corynebacterium felinum TaxID=131318 RepID=A0ABU2B7M1_9CORY|nr:response regulator transcription factor [Corynebacterium felinum]MDF5820883.1 response regulator transcription factor [Corynebacterium felinum]MDR7354605.1 DNA-binding NarL/FixJ family response regulator [Corynebacterium felinum]WJY93970.1 Transcriptional regulatory protein LiaR [Corynebacterium felinum]
MLIGLVDDQALVRAGFAMVLESEEDIHVAWQANNGEEALQLALSQPVDVILMDIQMPVLNGIDATEQILAHQPVAPGGEPTRIIVLTTFDTDNYVIKSIEAGASGFLLKDTSPENLIDSVRTVSSSSAVISPAATVKLFGHLRNHHAAATPSAISQPVTEDSIEITPTQLNELNAHLIDPLTMREAEILSCIAFGWSNTEIAQRLFISLPTVKTHIGRVLSKTGSRDRVHAVLFALRTGLVSVH